MLTSEVRACPCPCPTGLKSESETGQSFDVESLSSKWKLSMSREEESGRDKC